MFTRLLVLALICAAPAAAQIKQVASPQEAPYSLTTPDGTGLALVGLDARAVVDGPLAFTELRFTFENPHPRTIEGHFKVTMPDGAAISRFAMKIRGDWMEGEVVEKQAARRAYEDALHRRQDPALLEQDSGNLFRARVFPIRANERKEIIVSWSHNLTQPGEAYRLPLGGLPEIESLSLTALTSAEQNAAPKSSLGGSTARYQVTKVEKKNFKPTEDWIVFGGKLPEGGDALRRENLAVARFVIPGDDAKAPMDGAVILFDTSASRAIDYETRLASLKAFVNGLASQGVGDVGIIAFDQNSEQIFSGAPKAFDDAALAKLRERGALGASSIEVAVKALAGVKSRRVIFFTDGMITAGEQDKEQLRTMVAALATQGVARIDAVVDTTARDSNILELLVTANAAGPGKVIEGRQSLAAQYARLTKKTLPDINLSVAGAKWVWPSKVRGAQPGDAVVLFADIPDGRALSITASGGATATIAPKERDAEKPLLERAWISARIKKLENQAAMGDPDLKAALKNQIVTLSTRYRVLSPYTALVVLETERDYHRFGIDRKALADILVVGPTGVELAGRSKPVVAVRTPPPPPRKQPMRVRTAKSKDRRGRANRGGDGAPMGGAPATAAAPAEGLADATSGDDFGDVEMEKKVAEAPAPGRAGGPPAADIAAAQPMAEPEPVLAARPQPKPAPARTESRMAAADKAEDEEADEAEAPRVAAKRAVRRTRGDRSRRPRPDPFPVRRPPPPPRRPLQVAKPTGEAQGRRELREIEKGKPSLLGEMAEIDALLTRGKTKKARAKAQAWRDKDPTDLLALVALGRSLALTGDGIKATRAFGSILDLYPSRADMRRMAGGWLALLAGPGLELAADTFRVAMSQRPDHPSVYHQLAMVLVRMGRYDEAMTIALKGVTARRVNNRFEGVERILQEDAQIIGAAWAAAMPGKRADIEKRLGDAGLKIDDRATMRFVLSWETDANDVDFHIFDGKFNHAYYSRRSLASGGELYADVTTGYGPECFTIWDPKAFNYKLKAHYYRKGPMGHGAGAVQVIRHDGKGNLGFDERPFVIMQDGAYIDLGTVDKRTATPRKLVQAIAK